MVNGGVEVDDVRGCRGRFGDGGFALSWVGMSVEM